MRLDDYVRAARTNAALIVVLAVVGCIAGLLVTLTQTPQYRSTVSVYVSTQQATNLNDLTQGSIFTQQVVKSYASAIPTGLVLKPALASLGMTRSSRSLATDVLVENPLDTTILDISVTDPSPVNAARLANAIQASLTKVVTVLTPPTADSVDPVQIIVLDGAVASTRPVSPNTALNVAIGGIIGVALAIFFALFRNALARRARADGPDERRVDEPDGLDQLAVSPVDLPRREPGTLGAASAPVRARRVRRENPE